MTKKGERKTSFNGHPDREGGDEAARQQADSPSLNVSRELFHLAGDSTLELAFSGFPVSSSVCGYFVNESLTNVEQG